MQTKQRVADDIVSFIEDETWVGRDGYEGEYTVRDGGVDLWLPVNGARMFWALFTHISHHDNATLTAFKVNPNGVRGTDYRMYARVGTHRSEPVKSTPQPLSEYVETARSYHKFTADEFTPEVSQYKCGDINKTLREGLRFEYGERFQLAAGAIFNPMTNKGQGHMFVVIPSRHISDRDHTVFLDGAALQFASGVYDWPQCLGPAETIDRIHTVGPTHEHRPYYARDDDDIETEYAYEEN